MRSEFEKMPEVAEILKSEKWDFVDNDYIIYHDNELCLYVQGAWYAFQEQQKKIDQHNQKLKVFIDELRKTHNDDKENKIDYWRGFSECADSSAKVFLRDVGFIE